MRKLKTNKTAFLHRNHLRKYKPQKPTELKYQEAQLQIEVNNITPQDDLYTIAGEAEFGGNLFDFLIIYTDPDASDFDESHSHGPDTDIVPRSYFHDSSDGQNWESCPAFDLLVVHPSNPKSHDQNQDAETTTNVRHKDSSKQTRTLQPTTSLYNIPHRGRVTPFDD